MCHGDRLGHGDIDIAGAFREESLNVGDALSSDQLLNPSERSVREVYVLFAVHPVQVAFVKASKGIEQKKTAVMATGKRREEAGGITFIDAELYEIAGMPSPRT